SDQLVHFQWKQYATEREEEQHKLRQLHALSDEEVNALQKLSGNLHRIVSEKITNRSKHAINLSRNRISFEF
ncbi:unnamed protein product, partial [Rotaria magnacalcarata]